MIVVIVCCWFLIFKTQKPHPLAESIGLPVVNDVSDSSMHFSERALVFSKKGVEYNLYDFVCTKATLMYGKESFEAGTEIDEAPEFDLLDEEYSQGLGRALRIDSRDQYSTIWIIDYQEYVVVFLLQRR